MKISPQKFEMLVLALVIMLDVAFATLLTSYGKVRSSAKINPPIFYASATNLGGSVYSLYINYLPHEAEGTLTFQDESRISFVSQALNVSGWPPATWEIFLNIATNKIGNKVEVALEFVKSDYSRRFQICSEEITLDSASNKTYEIDCPSNGTSDLSPEDMLKLKVGGIGPTSEYTLYVDGTTRIEISYESRSPIFPTRPNLT